MKAPRAANKLRIRRRQLCIKWRVGARGVSFHIPWTSKHITDDGVGVVWLLFNEALYIFYQIQIRTSAWPMQSIHSFSPQQVLSIRSVRRAWLHRAWTWLILQWVIVKVWHSLSVEDLVEIPPSGHVCHGSRLMSVCNYGKGTTTWRKRLRRHVVIWSQAGWRCLKGRSFTPSGFALYGLPGEDTSHCPFGDIIDSTNGSSFHTRYWSPYYTPSLTFGRTYYGCLEEILTVKRHGRSKFTGHGFVTTGSSTMKHE